MKAIIKRGTNSNKSFKGFWKKISYIFSVLFGAFLDLLIAYFNSIGYVKINENLSFGTIIGIYIILNECISICENLRDCGVKLPRFITNMLLNAEESIDNGKKTNKK